jgi:hypothetical protein
VNGILFILIVSAVIAAALFRFADAVRTRGQWSAATLVRGITGAALLAYGMLGFLGAFLSATGPSSVERRRHAVPDGIRRRRRH